MSEILNALNKVENKLHKKSKILEEFIEKEDMLLNGTRLFYQDVQLKLSHDEALNTNSIFSINKPVNNKKELFDYTLSELNKLFRTKKISPLEVFDCYVQNIQKNKHLKAFCQLDIHNARNEIKRMERCIPSDDNSMFLFGIPVALKDNISTKGIKTTAGSKLLSDYIPSFDATVVKLLKQAGAALIGKTVTLEFAYSDSYQDSFGYVCHNPFGQELIPGGSSCGSAVAVSSNCVPVAIGTDTVGSVRIPAAFCGVVGFKPTYHLIDRFGVIPLSPSLDTIGFLGRCVEDMMILFQITSKNTKTKLNIKEPSDSSKLTSANIGILPDHWLEFLDESVAKHYQHLLKRLNKCGAKIETIRVPNQEILKAIESFIVLSEASTIHRKQFTSNKEKYSKELQFLIELGFRVRSEEYILAMECRKIVRDTINSQFKNFDFILSPTVPISPPKYENVHEKSKVIPEYVRIASLCGLPSITIPYWNGNELPIGIQISSGMERDLDLLIWGQRLEHFLENQ